MIVLVAGSRTITDRTLVAACISQSGFDVTVLITGMARGVDWDAYLWALDWNQERAKIGATTETLIEIRKYPVTKSDWETYGNFAGMRRNRLMVDRAEGAVIVWDGYSAGTKNTLQLVKQKGIPYFLLNTRTDESVLCGAAETVNAA